MLSVSQCDQDIFMTSHILEDEKLRVRPPPLNLHGLLPFERASCGPGGRRGRSTERTQPSSRSGSTLSLQDAISCLVNSSTMYGMLLPNLSLINSTVLVYMSTMLSCSHLILAKENFHLPRNNYLLKIKSYEVKW